MGTFPHLFLELDP